MSANCKHTPWPWIIDGRHLNCVRDAQGTVIANTDNANQYVNARLIAAAPDLLKSLEDMIEAYVFAFELGRDLLIDLGSTVISKKIEAKNQQVVLAARAAIAKATGKEPTP